MVKDSLSGTVFPANRHFSGPNFIDFSPPAYESSHVCFDRLSV